METIEFSVVVPVRDEEGNAGPLAERWGRSRGCRELGSDTALQNAASAAAHRALGFEEVGRLVAFRRAL